MPKIQVNDISMYYEIHGQGEPLVLIAGFSVDHLTWAPAVEILKERYQVIVLDNRGAGQTDVPQGPYSIAQMAHDVAGLCRALNISTAHFVGNSMGGFILQELSRHHPKLIKSAVFCNTALSIHCIFHVYADAQLDLIKAKAPPATIMKATSCWAFSYNFLIERGMLQPLIELALSNPFPFTVTGYEGQYAALDDFDSTQWAHEINVPALVLSGDQDLIFSDRVTKKLADTIPNAKFFCFENCGHVPMLEYPEQFSKVVGEFIDQHH